VTAFGITPAYAGKSFFYSLLIDIAEDHPRIRGEKSPERISSLFSSGSPPHTRGKVWAREKGYDDVRITPAYAGKSMAPAVASMPIQDHPRIRGEKTMKMAEKDFLRGSPPHTRGKGNMRKNCGKVLRITPAYAGKSDVIV